MIGYNKDDMARMLDAWTSFCRTGDPGWPAYRQDAPYKQPFDI